ncbi:class I SAM-dependent methyltransferase [Actinomadura rupiterrae]|uniref:class I SAM-dependent methyltransferase n=1 Tax=Actinomadura rupiterrae TaxID=559627 RepID=UPI0020A5B060|nr:class I SAM-dependent methyltransferase [Actinomadura rupiterrae]MCP2337106.1 SAM-dependent methyltransferase [Actinomadura rupiterrae]
MPHPATTLQEPGRAVAPHLRRLLDFAEPRAGDVCLDVARGPGPLPAALSGLVRRVTAVDAASPLRSRNARTATTTFGTGPVRIADLGEEPVDAVPPSHALPFEARRLPAGAVRADASALPYQDRSFSLVTTRFALFHLGRPERVLRELLRVCRRDGRVVIADLVRGNTAGTDRDRIERLRDPNHPGTPSIAGLTELIVSAGANVQRLDVFTVERPLEPWLAGASDADAADVIRTELLDEVDGGPRTGAKPRIIGGELWFTQSWAHLAAEPI